MILCPVEGLQPKISQGFGERPEYYKKCIFCGSFILNEQARKYCSEICNKRASYVRNLKEGQSSRFKPLTQESFEKTETGKGFIWESYAATLLKAEHCNLDIMNKPFDLEKDGITYNVKASNLYKRKRQRGKKCGNRRGIWVFGASGKYLPDYFLCICLKDNQFLRAYLIPSSEYPLSGCCIGHKSKYDQYLFRDLN